VCVCVPIVAVCPMRAALLGVACLRVFVWPLSVSLVGLGVWYAVEVRPAGYRERCAGACRCVYYCLIVLLTASLPLSQWCVCHTLCTQ
jgi:hypothetical protein